MHINIWSHSCLDNVKQINQWCDPITVRSFSIFCNFDILKGLGIVSAAHFVYDFSTRMFLMLYSINWPNFIVCLPLLYQILDNMCIAIVYYPGCDVINFRINLIFLIKPFLYMTKKSRQKHKYLENKKSF